MIIALWLPALVSLATTLALSWLLRPRPQPLWQRARSIRVAEIASWGLQFSFWAVLLQRPWFAAVVLASLQLLIIQISNTKSRTLGEPFLFQDFEYFLDAIRHPRLYLPFFGIGLTIAASLAGLAAITAGFILEPSLLAHGPGALATALLPGALALVALPFALKRLPACTLDPVHDLHELGLSVSLWHQARLLRQPLADDIGHPLFSRAPPDVDAAALPHVVIVQSESFFDPRDWYHNIRPEVLSHFDELCRNAVAHGPLTVPARGANTVRSECGFLTALPPEQLGGHRFNPYYQLAGRSVPNLVGQLRALGYRTVAIHPWHASFYLRDRVFPRMGFDEFIAIEAFEPHLRDGQYIGDSALAARARELLNEQRNGDDDRPLLVMIITMENHGPLHLEKTPEDAGVWYHEPAPAGCRELDVYLRHLHNADRMLMQLARTLGTQAAQGRPCARDGILCFYGDHIPIMDHVYSALDEPSGTTRYLLWSTAATPLDDSTARALDITRLGPRLFELVQHLGAGNATPARGCKTMTSAGEAP
ncbi:LTA synthase family protein [Kushneria aurantia]|uniref:LTA synthase family protein n=1 Tax=Kushneria aurantia TaxID=504092 RepID=A0ABV6G4Q7_9GAMM|nr:LTA synthase family protein [Kushneria aurantia]